MNTTMMNKVELNDEMLAQVSGGNSVNESEERNYDSYFTVPVEEFERILEEVNRQLRERTPKFSL